MQEALKNRYVLECSLKTLSPLHIGSEKAVGFGVDNPIIKIRKDGKEIPVIPGSSIKGVLRAHFYRLANSGVMEKLGYKVFKGDIEKFEREFSRSSEEGKKEKFKELGTLEKFFGISGVASPLRITDAEPENNNYSLGTRTHVKIDPKKDRAEEGRLFSVEFVVGTFKFKMIFDEFASDYDDVNRFFHEVFYPSLKNGLELHFGGMKSRGYGLCGLKIEKALRFSAQGLALGKAEQMG
jgi:CRISPR/Cas system CSM-associated protein Csm3 (group 7 of RAMP superfamily)